MRYSSKNKKITIQDKIVEKFTQIIKEYIDMLAESKNIHDSLNPVSNMYIGMNAIFRVFEYIFLKTKNLEKVSYYSKRTYYYYLEYIEQIYSSNLYQNLNKMDAVLFVYKKTIFDLFNGENEDSYGTITNIMTMNDEIINIDDVDIKKTLKNISNCINVLFYWENSHFSFQERKEISNKFLELYLKHTYDKSKIIPFLEIIQKRSTLNFQEYMNLLKEIIEYYEKKKKYILFDEDMIREWQLDRFYTHREEFEKKIEGANYKDLVEWIML
jgi:hypothetical protein